MKIVQESAVSMVIKDYNYNSLVIGIVFIVLGSFSFFKTEPLRNLFDFKVILTGIFPIVGLYIVLITKFTTIVLDKAQNKITFTRKSILGTKHDEVSLAPVVKVELKQEYKMETVEMNANTRGFSTRSEIPRLYYQLALVSNNGQEVQLESPKRSSGVGSILLGGRTKAREVGQKIATFLNVPFQEISPPDSNAPISLKF